MKRTIIFIFIILFLGGCAIGAKKQQQVPQPVTYENPKRIYPQETYSSRTYDYEDSRLYESYEKPAKKTYSGPIELSAKQIQQALKKANFYQGSIDGKIGTKTKEAIIKFQKANGLKVDGVVGKRTSSELNKYLSR